MKRVVQNDPVAEAIILQRRVEFAKRRAERINGTRRAA